VGTALLLSGDAKYCPLCGSPTERYLTLDELAYMTSMSVEFWRARIKAREIDYVKIGRAVRVPLSALESIIKQVPAINTNTINSIEDEHNVKHT